MNITRFLHFLQKTVMVSLYLHKILSNPYNFPTVLSKPLGNTQTVLRSINLLQLFFALSVYVPLSLANKLANDIQATHT